MLPYHYDLVHRSVQELCQRDSFAAIICWKLAAGLHMALGNPEAALESRDLNQRTKAQPPARATRRSARGTAAGCDRGLKDNDGQTGREVAEGRGHAAVVVWLRAVVGE